MKSYSFINNLLGWLVFALASFVYALTVEPSASFWDCGEFIAAAFKLQVGHPPGAPLFLLFGRIASLFAFGNLNMVALMVNMVSVFMSGLTIMFLFWTSTYFGKKIIYTSGFEGIPSKSKETVLFVAAFLGSLSFAFTDSFWFSAVEAEVYASSSLCTALVFWLILKWDAQADDEHAFRWIVLIAYVMGLSIGIHLLNLLAIPAIVMLIFFKRNVFTTLNLFKSLGLGVGVLILVQYGLIPGIPFVSAWFDLLFVNVFQLPFFSGAIFFSTVLILSIAIGLWYSFRKKNVLLNKALTILSVLLIGYSSYTVIVIRALANPPMNENAPDNMFSLLSYVNRDQYGNQPLVWGPYYDAPVKKYTKGKSIYSRVNNKYELTDRQPEYQYNFSDETFFPRMYSSQASHISNYKSWGGVQGEPDFLENFRFFLTYQFGHMYLRYFLWNFVGRQNDIQGYGSSNAGNFATGIPFFDDNLIFPISKGPAKFSQHIAYNKYYALPLLFGIVGLFFLRKRYKLAYAVSLSLFLFTGLAIILYLNQTPNQARERDYAYVGSFYAFGIFIAMGFLALFLEILKRKPNSKYILWGTFLVSSFVPLNLLTQNYDDHDRSGRYIARDWAKNYLDSCEPNAILFTYGDNDTFPLWYVQDVEGFRTDVRIVNLSLLGTDWYIDQCKRTSYKSEPLPILMNRGQYVQGRRDVIALFDQVKQPILLQNAYKAILSDNDMDKLELSSGNKINYLPAKTFLLPANQNIRQWTDTLQHKLSDTLVWKYSGDYLFKNDLAVLDLLTHFNWKRPVYFAVSVGEDNLYNLQKYLRLDGLAYKLTPQQNDSLANGIGWIDTDILYKNLIEKFQWGGVEKQSNLFDYQLNRSVRLMELRKIFKRLATALVAKHDNTRAVIVLDRIMKLLPINKMPFEMQLVEYVELYYKAGALAKADNLSNELWDDVTADAAFYYDLPDRFISDIDSERNTSLLAMKQLMQLAKKHQRIQNLNKMKTSIVDVLGGNPFEKEL